MKRKHDVQLITYADSLGGDLKQLNELLNTAFSGLFSGVHILPPFPSSADRGFAPIDYTRIEPSFGSWEDIKTIGASHEVLLDLMVNHISSRSPQFQDFLAQGDASPYARFFLTPEQVCGSRDIPTEALNQIILRRPKPWSDYQTKQGETLRIWTTFGQTDPSEQIDLDVNNPEVRAYFEELFRLFASQGVSAIRLDAVGYVNKKMGTSCFFVEPDIYEFLDWAESAVKRQQMSLLSEIHANSAVQYKLARQGRQVYDFLLPYTVLHTLINRDSRLLYQILENRPENQITMLDCHDGVPVQPDMEGWLEPESTWNVVNTCKKRGARFTRLHSAERGREEMPDVHQICGTFYSLLGEDDLSYLIARAIQLFVPGTPQIYYVGLLAGANDEQQRSVEGDDRGLDRHNYTQEEILDTIERPVVTSLFSLIRLRNSHPAFQGTFLPVPSPSHMFQLHWKKEQEECCLDVDLRTMAATVTFTKNGQRICKPLADL